MSNEPPAPAVNFSIDMDSLEAVALERGLPSLMKYHGMTRNEVLAFALAAGFSLLLKKHIDVLEREQSVREAIRKLKSEEPVSNDELEVVIIAARDGHLGAQIVMEDFKRFGRSMNKGGSP
ncbi:MAG: hypothetical protein V4819_00940 [Verrucomicrobiota bacterium]